MSAVRSGSSEAPPAPHGLPRVLAGLSGAGEAVTLADHERVHGPLPLLHPEELFEMIEASGLRGRGGADFPTAQKLRAVAEQAARRRGLGRRASRVAVVVNGSETEPASSKDRLLLSRLPHLVLDGAELAARALGAEEVFVKVGERSTDVLTSLRSAISLRHDDVAVTLITGPDGYVAGEETATINVLGGGPPRPTLVPPRPFERGYRGWPTLVQNPETLAQIGLVARYGPNWYRELGTPADPGTALVTISGAVGAPGVYELAFGTSITALLDAAGGASEPLRALLVGGYFGTWVDARAAGGLRLAREDLRSAGCSLGSGVVIALGESACGLHESARVFDYLASQSAQQCGPCQFGLRAIADSFVALTDGVAHANELARLQRWCSEVRGRGACHHPDGAVRFLESALRVFAPEFEHHQRAPCSARPAGLPIPGAGAGARPRTSVARVPARPARRSA